MANRGVVPILTGHGGTEHAVYQLARQLAADGLDVTLVTDVEGDDVPAFPRLAVVPLRSRLLKRIQARRGGFFRWLVQHLVANLATAKVVRRILEEDAYDVVHLHGSLAALLVARRAGSPVVYTEHDATPWTCRYRRWWERLLRRAVYRVVNVSAFRRVDVLAPVFAALREEAVARWHIPAEKIVPITNGTDVDIFNPSRPGVSVVRDEHGLDSYCLFVGRLTPRKGPDLLLRAVAECEGLDCAVVGDGPMRARLEELAGELGIAERVVFTGDLDPALLGRVYADAQFFVLPSVSESTSMTTLEALACGTPVLTTRVAGAPELVRDRETGFLVKPGDLGELSMAVRFLAGDLELCRRMGENGRALVDANFRWSAVSAEYGDLYRRLAAESGDRDPSTGHAGLRDTTSGKA